MLAETLLPSVKTPKEDQLGQTYSLNTFGQTKSAVLNQIRASSINRKFIKQGVTFAITNHAKTMLYGITKTSELIEVDLAYQDITRKLSTWKFPLYCVSISEDEQRLVLGDTKGFIHTVSLKNFSLLFTLEFESGTPIKGIAVSPKGDFAQVLTGKGDLARITLSEGEKKGEVKMREKKFIQMRPNGDFFIGSDSMIRLCNLDLGPIKDYSVRGDILRLFLTDKYIIAQLEGVCLIIDIDSTLTINDVFLPQNTTFITLSPDEKLLFAATAAGKLVITDLEFEERELSLDMNSKAIHFVFFVPHKDQVGTLSLDTRISVANIPVFKQISTFKAKSALVFMRPNTLLYQEKSSIYVQDYTAGTSELLFRYKNLSPAMLFLPPRHLITTSGSQLISLNIDNKRYCVFDHKENLRSSIIVADEEAATIAIATGKHSIVFFDCISFSFSPAIEAHTSPINAMVFVNEETMASGGSELLLWDVPPKEYTSLKAHEGKILRLAATETYLFAASDDYEIYVWNCSLRLLVYTLEDRHSNRVNSLWVTQESLVSSDADEIRFWDLKTLTMAFSYKPLVKCESFGFSKDRAKMYYSSGTTVVVADNPYMQTEFEVLGGKLNDVSAFMHRLKNTINMVEIPYDPEYTKWVIMPYRINLGHVYVNLNRSSDLREFVLSGGPVINNINNENILSQSVEKNLDLCTSVVISGLRKRVNINPFAFGFLTHKMLLELNNRGSEMLLKLYDSIYKISTQNRLETFCSSSVALPIYIHSTILEINQESFFKKDPSQDEAGGVSIVYKQSLVKLHTDVGSTNSKEFLASLGNCPNQDIFKSTFIQELLIEKWAHVSWILYFQGIIYILHIFVFGLMLGYQDYMILQLLLFILNLILTLYEIAQFAMLLLDYFADIWNIADLFRLLTMNLYIILIWAGAGEGEGTNNVHTLSGIISVLVFLRGITYFRLFEPTRYMIDLIQEVLIDMRGFLMVLTYSIISFAFIFYACKPSDDDTGIVSLITQSYMINFGSPLNTMEGLFLQLMVYIATFVNPIILLNLLISLMGNTFSRVDDSRVVSNYKELADMVLEAEQLMYWKKADTASYLQSCSAPADFDQPEPSMGKLKKLTTRTENIEAKVDDIDEKVTKAVRLIQTLIDTAKEAETRKLPGDN